MIKLKDILKRKFNYYLSKYDEHIFYDNIQSDLNRVKDIFK